jgi:hypothetical protein
MVSTTATSARTSGSPNGKLSVLYDSLMSQCESIPTPCTPDGLIGSASLAALDFCTRFGSDALAVFKASGLGDAAFDQQVVDLNNTDFVQGGSVEPEGGNAVGCTEAANPGGMELWLAAAPPARILGGAYAKTLPFGKPCITQASLQFGTSSVDMGCNTGTGWVFDVVEAQTASLPLNALRDAYETIVADLGP